MEMVSSIWQFVHTVPLWVMQLFFFKAALLYGMLVFHLVRSTRIAALMGAVMLFVVSYLQSMSIEMHFLSMTGLVYGVSWACAALALGFSFRSYFAGGIGLFLASAGVGFSGFPFVLAAFLGTITPTIGLMADLMRWKPDPEEEESEAS